jgi:hypothetical protein
MGEFGAAAGAEERQPEFGAHYNLKLQYTYTNNDGSRADALSLERG